MTEHCNLAVRFESVETFRSVIPRVEWLAATGFGQAQMGGRAGLGEST